MDYKNTLNLPKTDFPMKADLVLREPQRLEKWQATRLYDSIRAARAGAEKFVLHDGPPFANGDVHIGTALNKILKDIIIKYKTLRGFDAPYVPGWDCHGLPIEFKVSQEMRKAGNTAADPATIRTACEAYARKYIDIQRTQFKRLGVLGDWENPYLTLNKEYEADELRLFADLVEQGFVYRGKKPVYWSIPCRTALAEAEVEYADHVSQSVYVRFRLQGEPNTYVIIWTTTPWTLPANLAVAFNPIFFYSYVQADDATYLVCDALLETVSKKCGWTNYQIIRTASADELATLVYEHPFCPRSGKLFPAGFVENSTGTGFVHIAPGHGMEDYQLGRQVGLPIYSPVNDDGGLAATSDLPREQQLPEEMVGKSILEKHGQSEANNAVLHELRVRTALLHQENYHHSYPHCWRSKTPVIFRAMDQWFIKIDLECGDLSPLCASRLVAGALPESGASLKFDGDKSPAESGDKSPHSKTFRQHALAEIDRVKWIPDWGINRIKGAVESRPDWCISRQRSWGVPIPAFYDAAGNPILDARIVRAVAALIEQHGSNVWFEKTAAELWALVAPSDWSGPAPVAKSSDTLDVWIDSGSSSRAILMRRTELQHDNSSTSELNSLDDKLTGIPTAVPGRADFAGARQGDGQAPRPSLSQLGGVRADTLRRLRAETREAPRGRAVALPLIRLDDLGWKQPRAARQQLRRSYEVFTEDASTRLEYVGEGMEAFVYRAPENPGVVYKFFPLNVGETGVALRFDLHLDAEGRLDFEASYSKDQADLVDKVWLLNALGLPTEILGITEEGAIVVKQAEVAEPAAGADAASFSAQTGGLILYAPGADAIAAPASIERETKVLWLDGEFWLLGDLWEANRMVNGGGVTHIVDAIATVIPADLATKSASLGRFLRDVEAHAREHQSATQDGVTRLEDTGTETRNSKPETSSWQSDVYLEGSDQHRGWFQSSLLLSLAGNGAAPFKTVLTHGFMVKASKVDPKQKEKVSKSAQASYEKPETADRYVNQFGADVVRLWVASQDYRGDIWVGDDRIEKVAETYRLLRNTLRYQLSNLYDFDPARHTVADANLTGLDRWILGRFSALEADVIKAYDAYEFHVVYQRLSQFAAVELSSIYHDAVKDRLYTDPANSPRRRSTQTALQRLVIGLSQMLAPLLAYTTDEAWETIPGKPAPSVHASSWQPRAFAYSAAEQSAWDGLFLLREKVLPHLEKARQAKEIGKALDAQAVVNGSGALFTDGKTHGEALRELLNVSQIEIHAHADGETTIAITKSAGQKCERCWHWELSVGETPAHPTLCPRCVEAVQTA